MKLPRNPAAVIFDMDGLIFDTEKLYRETLFAVADERGHVMTDALHKSLVGTPPATTNALLAAHYGPDFAVDPFRTAWMDRFHVVVETALTLKPGVIELLDALDEWGLPRAIATSSRHASADHHLAAHDLRHRFHAVIAHGDYANGKPAPDPFLTAAARLGVAPDLCVALEDSHNGVRSACAAGMMTIMVPDLLDATEEMQGICTRISGDLHMVRDIIRATLSDG